MKRTLILRHLKRDQEGATAIEFAIVALVFFTMMFATIEYGLIMFTKVAIESAVQQAGREASIGNLAAGCADRVCTVEKLIKDRTDGIINKQAVLVTSAVVSAPLAASPPKPDICLDDINDPDPPTCALQWMDNNNNGSYDPPSPTPISVGNPGDLVEIRATYVWRVLFPILRQHFGVNGAVTITSSTVIKNEPF